MHNQTGGLIYAKSLFSFFQNSATVLLKQFTQQTQKLNKISNSELFFKRLLTFSRRSPLSQYKLYSYLTPFSQQKLVL